MRRCVSGESADLLIDGIQYRLERLSEVKILGRMSNYRGIAFPQPAQTLIRLEAEHKEYLRRKREAKKAAALSGYR